MDIQAIQVQALVTFLMPLLIQLAKRSQVKWLDWIDQAKPKVCMATSAITALLTAGGIQFAHAPGTLTIHYPDATTFLHGVMVFLVSAIFQLAGQHALYDGFWRYVVTSSTNAVGSKQLPGSEPASRIPSPETRGL
jgi:hypothetical protein